jgi:hypothetical protein
MRSRLHQGNAQAISGARIDSHLRNSGGQNDARHSGTHYDQIVFSGFCHLWSFPGGKLAFRTGRSLFIRGEIPVENLLLQCRQSVKHRPDNLSNWQGIKKRERLDCPVFSSYHLFNV